MAEYVQPEEPRIGRPAKYPWDVWTKASLEKGLAVSAIADVDFTCSPRSFRISVLTYARTHQLRAVTSIEDNTVTFQFFELKEK